MNISLQAYSEPTMILRHASSPHHKVIHCFYDMKVLSSRHDLDIRRQEVLHDLL